MKNTSRILLVIALSLLATAVSLNAQEIPSTIPLDMKLAEDEADNDTLQDISPARREGAGGDNSPRTTDLLSITSWSYFPSADSYYLLGYNDLYPATDAGELSALSAAYRVAFGLNAAGDVVAIEGTAYLLTRSSGYSHDWHLTLDLPREASGRVNCASFTDASQPRRSQSCTGTAERHVGGTIDLVAFNNTRALLPDAVGLQFVAVPQHSGELNLRYFFGPRTDFQVDFDTPVAAARVQIAPLEPYLYVHETDAIIGLGQPRLTDSSSESPQGVLLSDAWKPPLEFSASNNATPVANNFANSEGHSALQWYSSSLPDALLDTPEPASWSW